MDDQVAGARTGPRRRPARNKPQPLVERSAAARRSSRSIGSPVDVLHDEVGQAVVGRAAVEQARDVRVLERGEDLPLGAKRASMQLGVQPRRHDLDRHPLRELAVGALGQVDRAHAAAADLAFDRSGR